MTDNEHLILLKVYGKRIEAEQTKARLERVFPNVEVLENGIETINAELTIEKEVLLAYKERDFMDFNKERLATEIGMCLLRNNLILFGIIVDTNSAKLRAKTEVIKPELIL